MTEQQDKDFADLIAAIKEAHATHPNLRIGQLILNSIQSGSPGVDPFYVHDADLARMVREFSRYKAWPEKKS